MDCSLPGSSVHGIFQARVLEGIAIAFSEGMLSKSLIQFSVDGQGYIPSLLFDLRPNYAGSNEDNVDLLQKVSCCTQTPQPCSRPPPTHTSARDSWTLSGKSGSVSDCCLKATLFREFSSMGCVPRLVQGGQTCSFLLGPGMH